MERDNRAALARFVADARSRDWAYRFRAAEHVNAQLSVLEGAAELPDHLLGLSALDLANARDEITAGDPPAQPAPSGALNGE